MRGRRLSARHVSPLHLAGCGFAERVIRRSLYSISSVFTPNIDHFYILIGCGFKRKLLPRRHGVAIICLVQLNRGLEGRDDKRPSLSDLRWSGAIEQDADVVGFVYREAYYLSKPLDDPTKEQERQDKLREKQFDLELIIGKHRGGPTPTLHFYCDIGCGVVRDI